MAVKYHCGFTTVRETKHTSQHCCDKTMGGKLALNRECCFPNCTKSSWKKLLFPLNPTLLCTNFIRWKRVKFSFVWEFSFASKPVSRCKLFGTISFKIVLCLHIKVVVRPPMEYLHITFDLFWKILDLLHSLLYVFHEWFINFLTKQCKN